MVDKKSVSTIILAAGTGDRLGGKGKAFVNICGETYLDRAVRIFSNFSDQVIVTLHPKEILEMRSSFDEYPCQFVEGGDTRQASFEKAFMHVTGSVVLVQDVARPVISDELIMTLLKAAEDQSAVAPVVVIKSRDSLS
ncbi:MAG: 2-C-methyl-D-erythritol 4-phosphate cytidylyltransferase, partial [Sneathiella sp.]|nr:2-C-methyl-D-erythritol 4-phosphate cytidylyltransferase [Sneathiella sp.]